MNIRIRTLRRWKNLGTLCVNSIRIVILIFLIWQQLFPILFSHPACSVITEEISASVTITIEISLLRFILQTWSMASATESILLRCPLMRRRYFCYSSKLLITAFSLMLFRSYGNTLASLSMISARKTPPTSLTPAHRLLCRPSWFAFLMPSSVAVSFLRTSTPNYVSLDQHSAKGLCCLLRHWMRVIRCRQNTVSFSRLRYQCWRGTIERGLRGQEIWSNVSGMPNSVSTAKRN